MKLFIGTANPDSLFENIKETMRSGDLWRVGHDGRMQLKIPNAAPLVKQYCPQHFERDENTDDKNHLIFVYVDLDPDPDNNQDIARYVSEMTKLLVLDHLSDFRMIRIDPLALSEQI
jgi:hypothetical protein